jgi:hypothetical protein
MNGEMKGALDYFKFIFNGFTPPNLHLKMP